jgi:hypothetical protein
MIVKAERILGNKVSTESFGIRMKRVEIGRSLARRSCRGFSILKRLFHEL